LIPVCFLEFPVTAGPYPAVGRFRLYLFDYSYLFFKILCKLRTIADNTADPVLFKSAAARRNHTFPDKQALN
jgi:hypothetical protein